MHIKLLDYSVNILCIIVSSLQVEDKLVLIINITPADFW